MDNYPDFMSWFVRGQEAPPEEAAKELVSVEVEKEPDVQDLVEYFSTVKEVEDIWSETLKGVSDDDLDNLSDAEAEEILTFANEFDQASDDEIKELIEVADAIGAVSEESLKELNVDEWLEEYKGKGNFGHVGIPGHRGGSAPRRGAVTNSPQPTGVTASVAQAAAPTPEDQPTQAKVGFMKRFVTFMKRGGVPGVIARGAIGAGKKYVDFQKRNLQKVGGLVKRNSDLLKGVAKGAAFGYMNTGSPIGTASGALLGYGFAKNNRKYAARKRK